MTTERRDETNTTAHIDRHHQPAGAKPGLYETTAEIEANSFLTRPFCIDQLRSVQGWSSGDRITRAVGHPARRKAEPVREWSTHQVAAAAEVQDVPWHRGSGPSGWTGGAAGRRFRPVKPEDGTASGWQGETLPVALVVDK